MEITTDLLLVAGLGVIVYILTQLVKTSVDVSMGSVEVMVDGKPTLVPKRKADTKKWAWLNRIVLPGIPPVLGCLLGALIPFRPVVLIEFVTEHLSGFDVTLAYAAYGTVVGQFSDYIYTKAKKAVNDFKGKKSGD